MNSKTQYPSTLRQNTNYTFLFILSVTVFFVGATEFMLSSMLTPLAVAFGTTTVGASWLVSGYAFSYALAAPVLGYFSDRVNRSRLLLGSLLFFAVDGLAIILAPTLEIAIALRIFGGIASAVIIPTVFALIADIVPYNRQAGATGVVMLGMTFGIAFGPTEIGLTVIAFGIGLGIGNISAGGLRKLCGREEATLVVVSLLLTGVISVFMLVPITLFGSLGCLIFWGIALGAGAPSSTVVLVTRASANKGMVLAFAETFNNLGILSLVPLAMIGLAKGGPPAAMMVLSVGLVIGLTLTILDFWLTRSKSSASSWI
ncbi:MFS transporter [Photorhabdus temperata]|uniref:Major facilitator superfamily (MFS) profile domain-containing protein n=1 Tax=Photorhabdus temperata J3 TaxID=1389415 RepID=U7QSP1_PHOTE|nr:MFS transporter [Photorhabdus temperata]ERT10984.1 hypothetical protein O185_21915 [Photorhabdus temperata J3]